MLTLVSADDVNSVVCLDTGLAPSLLGAGDGGRAVGVVVLAAGIELIDI